MSGRVSLVLPGRPYNINDRDDRFLRAKRVLEVGRATKDAVLEQWGSVERIRPLLTFPVTVHVRHFHRHNISIDTGNCFPAVKAAIDALAEPQPSDGTGKAVKVRLGLWPNDTPAWVGPQIFYPPCRPSAAVLERFAARGPFYVKQTQWLVLTFTSAVPDGDSPL